MEEQLDLPFVWLEDDQYQKAVGQLRLQLNGILGVFDMYGLGVHIPSAISAIVAVCEQFGMRVRGDDEPINYEIAKQKLLQSWKRS